ncbi:MAG: succinate dehydrogenase assembly factor 2 [Hyphomicrobiaceae bacterium]|nr:succinate dehydrogenase assembly factor 2 [Hyphomicrobiaceae bacterium]
MSKSVQSHQSQNIETRRRRAAYRANHRGTKEMDWLVGRFADARLDGLEGAALTLFEKLLEMPDPELQKWILEGDASPGADFAGLIEEIRSFHGLPARKPA